MEDKKEIETNSTDIEGGPSREAEVKLEDPSKDPVADQSLEDRTKKVAVQEAAIEAKLKELDETQELFRKEWDEKIQEIDSLKELHETPEDDLEDIDFETDEEKEDANNLKEEPPVVATPTEGVELETGFEKDVQREIKDEQDFRTKILKNQSILNRKFAERELNEDLTSAVGKYPKMDKREVLVEIQRDPTQNLMELAKKSEEDFIAREDKMREGLKSDLNKETEGFNAEANKAETIPSVPVGETTPSRQETAKDRWAQATKDAQGDLVEG